MERILKFNEFLTEVRVKDPNIKYDDKFVKDKLKKVIMTLKNQKGSAFTKLARQYHEFELQQKKLKELRDELNVDIKEKMHDYFDIEDSAITRVVESTSFMLTLSANTKSFTKKVNYDKVLNRLVELNPELKNSLDTLLDEYTTIIEKENKERLTVKTKFDESENVNEGLKEFWKFIKSRFKRIVGKIKKSYDKWDRGIEDLNRIVKISFTI